MADKIRNEEVLRRVEEERKILTAIKKRKRNWIGHCLRQKNGIIRDAVEGIVCGKRGRGRRRLQLLDDIKIGSYKKIKDAAEDREGWRKLT